MKKALPLAVFVVSAVWLFLTANLDGDFRIDEAHKISETYYLRLIERGDFGNPDWFSSPIERANPLVGKVVFGLAMQAAGVPLPTSATFATHPDPRGKPEEFRPALRPTRTVSLLATAGTAALAATLAGPIASALFLFSFLARTYADAAVFDALLVFFVVAAAVPVASKVTWPRTVAAAILAALAIGTRLSGGLALIGVIVLVRDWRKALAATAICLALAAVFSPAGWPTMIRDANAIIATTHEHRLTLLERLRFVSEYAFGDVVGLLTLAGIPFVRRQAILWWCLAIVALFTLWLPVGYPRYVFMTIPPFAIAAGLGYRQLVVRLGNFASGRRRSA